MAIRQISLSGFWLEPRLLFLPRVRWLFPAFSLLLFTPPPPPLLSSSSSSSSLSFKWRPTVRCPLSLSLHLARALCPREGETDRQTESVCAAVQEEGAASELPVLAAITYHASRRATHWSFTSAKSPKCCCCRCCDSCVNLFFVPSHLFPLLLVCLVLFCLNADTLLLYIHNFEFKSFKKNVIYF